MTCPYPVVLGQGMCCGHDLCDLEWYRPCDAFGGCLDRSTCGGCETPVVRDVAYEKPSTLVEIELMKLAAAAHTVRVLVRCVLDQKPYFGTAYVDHYLTRSK